MEGQEGEWKKGDRKLRRKIQECNHQNEVQNWPRGPVVARWTQNPGSSDQYCSGASFIKYFTLLAQIRRNSEKVA